MATVITADNVPAVLAEIATRQDQLDAQLETLTSLCADQAVRAEEQEEQIRVQAQALRVTATQLSRNISDASKAANGNRSGNGNPRPNGRGNPNGIAGAGVGGQASLGSLGASAEVGGRIGTEPSEPEPPERKKAHRWI